MCDLPRHDSQYLVAVALSHVTAEVKACQFGSSEREQVVTRGGSLSAFCTPPTSPLSFIAQLNGLGVNDPLRDVREVDWSDAHCMFEPHSSIPNNGWFGTVPYRTHFRLGHYCPLARDAESEYCTATVIAEFRPHRRGVVGLTKAENSRSFEQLQPPLFVCLQRPSGAFAILP